MAGHVSHSQPLDMLFREESHDHSDSINDLFLLIKLFRLVDWIHHLSDILSLPFELP